MRHLKSSLIGGALCAVAAALSLSAQQLTPHNLQLSDGRTPALNLPGNFTVNIAAKGMRRLRFLTRSPDGRIFATDMHDLSDNSLGRVDILDGWMEKTGTFAKKTVYLDHLRNPNNVAFYTEPGQNGKPGQTWLYLPLTDRLLRYKYNAGDDAPSGPPEVLAHYPDYGLNYKYGGWQLTGVAPSRRWCAH